MRLPTLVLTIAVLFVAAYPTAAPAQDALDFKAASEQIRRGEYVKAHQILLPLAEDGHAASQYNVGIMYQLGRGADQDLARAMRWYRKAAAHDHAGAQNNIGAMYRQGTGVKRDYAKAVRWFRKAAKKLNLARFNLASMYQRGRGVK